jgi:hypothetical protein
VNCPPFENRFNAIASHPVDRMIRVHAKSVIHGRKTARCEATAPVCREADARQCRIIVNALRREIDRLLRGIDPRRAFWMETPANPPLNHTFDHLSHTSQEIDFSQRASKRTRPPMYAPPLIGDRTAITQLLASHPGNTATPTGNANQPVGQLVDVLA